MTVAFLARAFVFAVCVLLVLVILMQTRPAMPFDIVVTQDLQDLLSIAGSFAFGALMVTALIVVSTFGLKGERQ